MKFQVASLIILNASNFTMQRIVKLSVMNEFYSDDLYHLVGLSTLLICQICPSIVFTLSLLVLRAPLCFDQLNYSSYHQIYLSC